MFALIKNLIPRVVVPNLICRASLLFALLLAFGVAAHAQDRAPGLQVAKARARHLQRGINTSDWFAQTGDYSAAHIDGFMDAQDVALIARLGFDNVRIAIDADALEKDPRSANDLNSEYLGHLDHAIDACLANGLAVQIDLHPTDNYKKQLRSSEAAADQLVSLWRKLAAHYAGRDPERVFFEILNEPQFTSRDRWSSIQERMAAAIHAVAARNTIIATGPNYSSIYDLLALHPLADGNVIYNFHFYDPHEFTHQGATWGLSWWKYTHGIPYPPDDAKMQALLTQVPTLQDRYTLENYWLDHWDGRHIRMVIDEAAAWSHQYNVPLICNEFGVYKNNSDVNSRANWIHDVRTALEADGIGWAMWEYRGSFGLVNKQDGQAAQPDGAIVSALGLKGR
jgi:endoglucanase